MTGLSQSLRDRILWLLTEHGGTMERSRLRRATGLRYGHLITILEELARDGRIKISTGKDRVMISLVNE